MGSGGVTIAALPTVICLKVPFSDGLGGGRCEVWDNECYSVFHKTIFNQHLILYVAFLLNV